MNICGKHINLKSFCILYSIYRNKEEMENNHFHDRMTSPQERGLGARYSCKHSLIFDVGTFLKHSGYDAVKS